MKNPKKPFFSKQKPMRHVLIALTPLCLMAVYLFGWYFLLVLAVCCFSGYIGEHLFLRPYNQPVSLALLVTAFIFALSLPPTIPLWIAAVGMGFGVVFGKMVFGGFGRNIFNPAITGRAFIYISFGGPLTSAFVDPFAGLPGGFAAWQPGFDALTKATPLYDFKISGTIAISWQDMFLGSAPGSYGETCALLIIIGGIYLLIKKVAAWPIVAGGVGGFALLQQLFVFLPGVNAMPVGPALLSGSLLFGLFFMATDPVSAGQTTTIGKLIYGFLIGSLTSLIRVFSIWPEGLTFAVLLGNMFSPLIGQVIKTAKTANKATS